MRLLFYSVLRHLKQHLPQTILTFAVTVLVTALFSTIFHFASSFQSLLREYALETVGDYHYKYVALKNSETAEMLCRMAADFREDSWFSNVILKEEDDNDNTELILTVASPNILTSKSMEKKYKRFETGFLADRESELQIDFQHNYALLLSYGDLSRESGMYSLLLIFFLMFAIIASTSIVTLGAVFQVSAARRERDFALLLSIGADSSQIKSAVLLESALYIGFAVPAGYFLGILFFEISKSRMDAVLYAAEKFPPIEMVISLPFSVALIICEICIILLSGLIPAVKAGRISPMEIFQRTRDIYVSKREKMKEGTVGFRESFCVERWLALKSHKRFRRQRRPVLLVLSITFALCFVLAGFREYAAEVMNMTYSGQEYNIAVNLYSDNIKTLGELANHLLISSKHELRAVREAVFELHSPYPYSEMGKTLSENNVCKLPDIMLVSVDAEEYQNICRKNRINLNSTDDIQGIYINTERVWTQNGVVCRGKTFEIEEGDTITMYGGSDGARQKEGEGGIDISIAGGLKEAPLYIDTKEATRMIVLVSKEVFLGLEPLRPFSEEEPGIHYISLRGLSENADALEKGAVRELNTHNDITGNVENYEKSMQQEKASVAGFEFLCVALIFLLVLVCICGNVTVSWTVSNARQKEVATLLSIGMKSGELRKMKYWELSLNIIYSFVPGFLAGIICHWLIFKIYSAEYRMAWHFPWNGLLFGILVLGVSVFITEAVLKIYTNNLTMADMLRKLE